MKSEIFPICRATKPEANRYDEVRVCLVEEKPNHTHFAFGIEFASVLYDNASADFVKGLLKGLEFRDK